MVDLAGQDPHDPYRALSPQLRALAQRGVQRHYAKGTVLLHEGDLGDTLFILLSGRLRVYGSSATDEREVLYGHCTPGDFFGELGLDGGERSASVQAVEPCVCVLITRETLLRHLREAPEFALVLLSAVIHRVRVTTAHVKSLALNDVYGRLKAEMEAKAQPQADGSRLYPTPRTHKDWAAQLGCSREMVSRILKDLERGGYVMQAEGGGLLLPKPLPPRW
jgi:CRP/FNR family transcriptional regulator, cyclic AMP receptor protein